MIQLNYLFEKYHPKTSSFFADYYVFYRPGIYLLYILTNLNANGSKQI